MDDLRVLIVAADPLARSGLAVLLAEQIEVYVAGQVATDGDWGEAVAVYRPTVVLWDAGWLMAAEDAAWETLNQIDLPVVALVVDESQAAWALAAGVQGILWRDTTAPRLAVALAAVRHDLAVREPALTTQPEDLPVPPELVEPLTPRETSVLHHLARGLTNKAIAQALAISPHTVKFHVSAIMTKLGVQSRTEAVVQATRLGLLPL